MKIPEQAKSVFKGEIFEVFQWPQKLFDGSTATFEMIKRPYSAQVIATRNNKILISEEEQPNKGKFVSMFGGRQELDESALEGAKRELLEEAGLTTEDWEHLVTYVYPGKIDWEITMFIARNVTVASEINLDAGEKITVREVSFDEFLEVVFSNYKEFGQFAFDLLKWKFLEPAKLAAFKEKLGVN